MNQTDLNWEIVDSFDDCEGLQFFSDKYEFPVDEKNLFGWHLQSENNEYIYLGGTPRKVDGSLLEEGQHILDNLEYYIQEMLSFIDKLFSQSDFYGESKLKREEIQSVFVYVLDPNDPKRWSIMLSFEYTFFQCSFIQRKVNELVENG